MPVPNDIFSKASRRIFCNATIVGTKRPSLRWSNQAFKSPGDVVYCVKSDLLSYHMKWFIPVLSGVLYRPESSKRCSSLLTHVVFVSHHTRYWYYLVVSVSPVLYWLPFPQCIEIREYSSTSCTSMRTLLLLYVQTINAWYLNSEHEPYHTIPPDTGTRVEETHK